LDPRPVLGGGRDEKSIGSATPLDTDVSDVDTVRRTLLSLATRVGARLRSSGPAGRTRAIKVRLAALRPLSRSRTLPAPTDVAREIFAAAWGLFTQLTGRPGSQHSGRLSERIRLLGVRVEGLEATDDAPRQLTLGEREHGWRDAERA